MLTPILYKSKKKILITIANVGLSHLIYIYIYVMNTLGIEYGFIRVSVVDIKPQI